MASMIGFLERKSPDFRYIESLLGLSARDNQWTNFGTVSARLEERRGRRADAPRRAPEIHRNWYVTGHQISRGAPDFARRGGTQKIRG